MDSVRHSRLNLDSMLHADYVVQEVWTADSVYRVPLAAIDSVSFAISYFSCSDSHHPHAIDLGLPSGTKWACCNVGATTPERYGGYYAWGETGEKTSYYESNYGYYNTSTGYADIGSDIAGTSLIIAPFSSI